MRDEISRYMETISVGNGSAQTCWVSVQFRYLRNQKYSILHSSDLLES